MPHESRRLWSWLIFDVGQDTTPMTIEDEIEQLNDLRHVGSALVQFSHSLFSGAFKKKSAAWIYSPIFVGFEIRYLRGRKLNLLVRPTIVSREISSVLTLRAGPLAFGRAEITNARQLLAACTYIEGSWRDWHRATFKKDPNL